MKIAILGTGMVSRTLASKLSSLGHDVTLGTRNIDNTMKSEKTDLYGNPPFKEWFKDKSEIKLKTFVDAAQSSELIFNCIAGQSVLAALEMAKQENLDGKVLLDVSNPLDFSQGMPPSLNPVNTDSLGEQIQRRFPNVNVVKTLNTMNAELMTNPSLLKGGHNVFVSGNNDNAKNQAKELLSKFGWRDDQIIDLGDISTARGCEMLLPIWIRLWSTLGTHKFNFHIQQRT